MGSWNYGSADNDNTLDWYPSKFDEEKDEFIPPTRKELDAALKDWLKAESRNPYDQFEFLGIVVKGLSENVVPSAVHLKKALSIAQSLIADDNHLNDYTDPAKRKAALKKEIEQLRRVMGGKAIAPRAKLTTGLFESIAMKATARTKPKKKLKADRPSPSISATQFKAGTRKKGNDGKLWKVTLTKSNVHRWTPV